MSDGATWIATLSNGETIAESDIDFKPGQRKPWIQLTEVLAKSDLHLTSLRLNIDGRTIHMPRPNFDRFGYDAVSRAPFSYSLCYHLHGVKSLETGKFHQSNYIELAAHYDNFVVSYIQDVTNPSNSWVVVTDDRVGLAETPRKK